MDIQGLFWLHLWNCSLPEASLQGQQTHLCETTTAHWKQHPILHSGKEETDQPRGSASRPTVFFWKKRKLQRVIRSCSVPLWYTQNHPHWKIQGINQKSSWPIRMQVHHGLAPLSWTRSRPHKLWTERCKSVLQTGLTSLDIPFSNVTQLPSHIT